LRGFLLTLTVLFIAYAYASAQPLRQSLSALYPAGCAYSQYQRDVFSSLAQPGALAYVRKTGAGVYSERRFLLAELGVHHLAAAMPVRSGAIGLIARYSGFEGYNETALGLAYSRRLGDKAAVGLQFSRVAYRVPFVVNDAAMNVELGALFHVAPKMVAGLHLYNPAGGFFFKSGERLSSAFKLGIGYDASEKFHVSGELLKEEEAPVNLLAGFQYHFQQHFFVRAGISSAVNSGFVGFGLAWGRIRLDLSGTYHPLLGFTPGLMLISYPGRDSGAFQKFNP
jgi:hypothetical protein